MFIVPARLDTPAQFVIAVSLLIQCCNLDASVVIV